MQLQVIQPSMRLPHRLMTIVRRRQKRARPHPLKSAAVAVSPSTVKVVGTTWVVQAVMNPATMRKAVTIDGRVDLPVVVAYIALGANLGDARSALAQAMVAIGHLPKTRLCKRSSLYKTAPLGCAASMAGALGGDYLNAVVQVETTLSAPELLTQLQHIEQQAGRQRSYRDAPRTLDLDVLLYGSASISSEQLTVPHPRMWQRAFVLLPLAEIAPDRVTAAQLHALAHQTVERLVN